MKYKIILFLFLSLLIFSCQPRVKPTKVSRAPQIKILLSRFNNVDSIRLEGRYTLQLEEALYELGKKNNFFYISPSKSGFKFYSDNRLFVFNSNATVILTPENAQDSHFEFHNNWYKGKIILMLDDQQNILLINQIDLEEYLKTVLVGEMPSNKDSYFEALKAQAICARTYALKRMKKNADKPFHVYSDVRDQVYASLKRQTRLASAAVQATRGVVLMYKDRFARTYFHSTCGGMLEDITNYWGGDSIPYLKSRKDIVGHQFACQPSPHFRWQKTFSFKQIDSLFQIKFHKPGMPSNPQDTIALHLTLKVLQRTSSGRVKSLEISYADTSVVLNNFSIRKFFSLPGKGALPSLLFKMQAVNDSTLLISGAGYGHGVGMCQWGALNMSEQGFKYYDILVNQYFPGTYLKEIY
ncbi:SpoIID/LytB domain-containing protein [Calditrichota bacterium LG25]